MSEKFMAGAGQAEIVYTEDMFPTFGENYTGIHDLPLLQCVYMQSGEKKYALISVDIVIMETKEILLEAASEKLGISQENILIHAAHVLATPHFRNWSSLQEWKEDFGHRHAQVSEKEAAEYMRRDLEMVRAHVSAIEDACEKAKRTLQPVKFGIGVTKAPISVNRVVETKNGWWQGVNQEGETDHNIFVLRFDKLDGSPLAILYNCNVAPGCMEFSTVNGGRMVSGDLAGASERFIENRYKEPVVAVYTTGFTGDQWQALRARLDYIDSDGTQVIEDLHEAGFELVKILGTRLGEQVVKEANHMPAENTDIPLHMDTFQLSYEGQEVAGASFMEPTKECRFIKKGTEETEVTILQIGNIAVIACGVELCSQTFHRIQKESPFDYTILLEFTTKGFGYMPEEIYYDRMGFQARKSPFARGTAERFGRDVIALLKKVYKKSRDQETDSQRNSGQAHIRGIIFDLDGVICFTDRYHYQAWKQIADQEKIYFDEEINQRLRGVSRMESLGIILEKASRTYSEEEKEKLAEKKNCIYRDLLNKMTENDLSAEVKATLDSLKKKGLKLAIGSSSKNTKRILRRIGLENYFDAVSDGTNISKSKPDPEVFLKAAEMLDIKPEECLVVEDADAGIEAAKRGGFLRAGIGGASLNADVDYPLVQFSDVLKIKPEMKIQCLNA